MPLVCESRRRSVCLPAPSTWAPIGSSRSSALSSRSWSTAAAVNVFVIEPMRYWVSAVARVPATSASPTASFHTSSPSRKTAAATLGIRSADWAVRSRRTSSGSDKRSEGPRDQLDRALDVLVVDPEVGRRAQDSWAQRPDEDALRGDAAARLRGLDPEWTYVDADEVRLDLGRIDGEPRGGE